MENWSFLQAVYFQIGGLLLVFAALCGIAVMMYGMGYVFRKYAGQGANLTFKPLSGEKPAIIQEGVPGKHLAIITAAVNEMIKEPHRIVSIRYIDAEQISGELRLQAWSVEGRRQNFTSHDMR